MFPDWTVIVGFYLGAIIGSFLNVVIYRLPRRIPLGKPAKSFCPACEHPLGVPDLFPLFSWLLLRGKCRYCKAKVSSRYFWVEILNGLVWGGLWWQHFVAGADPARAIAYALAGSALVAIIFIDWELLIIPDEINAFLLFVGLGYNGWLYYKASEAATTWGMPSSLAGWIVGTGVLWGIAFLGRVVFRKDAMGHGDIKMARGIGAVLFPLVALESFALAVVFGAVFGVAQVIWMNRVDRTESSTEPVGIDSEEEFEPPETIGSLLKCGLGYLLCIDVIGLFVPRLYELWFGVPAFATAEEEYENFEVERTMIPFGPYLALGAICAAVFAQQIGAGVDRYLDWVFGGDRMEHSRELGGQ